MWLTRRCMSEERPIPIILPISKHKIYCSAATTKHSLSICAYKKQPSFNKKPRREPTKTIMDITVSNSLRTFMQSIITESSNCNHHDDNGRPENNEKDNTCCAVLPPTVVVTIVVDNASLPSTTLLQTLLQHDQQQQERRRHRRIVLNPLVQEGEEEEEQQQQQQEEDENQQYREEAEHSYENEEEPIEAALDFVSPPTCRRLLSQQRCLTCKKNLHLSLDYTVCRCHGRNTRDDSSSMPIVAPHQQSSVQQQQKQQVPVTPIPTSKQGSTVSSENSTPVLKQSNDEKTSSPRSIMDISMFWKCDWAQ